MIRSGAELASCQRPRLSTCPPADASPTVLHLSSDGRANSRFGDGRLLPGPVAEAEPPRETGERDRSRAVLGAGRPGPCVATVGTDHADAHET